MMQAEYEKFSWKRTRSAALYNFQILQFPVVNRTQIIGEEGKTER